MKAPGELELLATDRSGWEQLFANKRTGELIEKTYPNGEVHGGGQARFETVTEAYARKKYSF
jgi:hypothetical protein